MSSTVLSDFLDSWDAGAWGEPSLNSTDAVSVLRSTNFRAGGSLSFDNQALLEIDEATFQKKRLQPGDLLLERSGGGPMQPVGRVAIFRGQEGRFICGNFISRLVPKRDEIDPDYLMYRLLSLHCSGGTESLQTATIGIRNLQMKAYLAQEFQAPELGEQRRIAAYLKAQLAATTEARNAAHAQASDAQKLIPAILKTTFEEVTDAEMVRIGDVAPTTSGSTPSRSQKDYWESPKYSWVKTGEVVFNPIRSTEEQVSEKALRECSLTLLPPGTVLVAMYGQGKTRGQSAILKVEATTNQACFAILPNEAFEPEYLQLWLRHSYEVLRTLSEARGGNQSNLNGALLNAFEVPLIPRKQQQAIAQRIRQALTEATAFKARIHEQLNEIELLPARLLTEAFKETEHA